MANQRLPSIRSTVLAQQRAWAETEGLAVDSASYLSTVEANLRQALSAKARAAFERGRGGELKPSSTRRAKMSALHSSSALAVNVFDYWTGREATPLLRALGIDRVHGSRPKLAFEEQLATGARGIPPNLDLLLEFDDKYLVGIESKFTEWMKDRKSVSIRASYFDERESFWSRAKLVRCHALATAINAGSASFRFLDAPQLLKHALGLARKASHLHGKFSLHYVYFDVPGAIGALHAAEIARFSQAVGSELEFHAASYQSLLASLGGGADDEHRAYNHYLRARYAAN